MNRDLFRSEFWDEYQGFDKADFEMFAAPGQPARLCLDVQEMRQRMGDCSRPNG
jgi:hypothetical protein